jgi:hypothetical protein
MFVAVLALVACGDDDNAPGGTTTTAATTTTAPATPTANATATQIANTSSVASTNFQPKISFTAPGWTVAEDAGNSFFVVHQGSDGYASIFFLTFTEVIDPGTLQPSPAPADLADWLRHHPALHIVDDQAVTVGGLSGTQLDFTSSTPGGVDLFSQPQGKLALYPEDAGRLIIVNGSGGTFVVIINPDKPANIATALQIAEPLIQSLRFR